MGKETDKKYKVMKTIMDALEDILCSYKITSMTMMITSGRMWKLSGFIRSLPRRQDGVSGSIHR